MMVMVLLLAMTVSVDANGIDGNIDSNNCSE
jgi:hypothetical protein